MNIEEAIKTSIEYETKVRDLYITAMKKVEDPVCRKIVHTMAKEEQGHLDYLNDRLEKWKESGKLDVPALKTTEPIPLYPRRFGRHKQGDLYPSSKCQVRRPPKRCNRTKTEVVTLTNPNRFP